MHFSAVRQEDIAVLTNPDVSDGFEIWSKRRII